MKHLSQMIQMSQMSNWAKWAKSTKRAEWLIYFFASLVFLGLWPTLHPCRLNLIATCLFDLAMVYKIFFLNLVVIFLDVYFFVTKKSFCIKDWKHLLSKILQFYFFYTTFRCWKFAHELKLHGSYTMLVVYHTPITYKDGPYEHIDISPGKLSR